MQTYELTLVIPGSMSAAKQKLVLDSVKKTVGDSGGKVIDVNEWGKKQLAYAIAKESEGFYYHVQLEMDTDRIGQFNRLIENDDNILRHLLIKSTPIKSGSKSKLKTMEAEEKGTGKKEKTKVKSSSKAKKK